MVKRSIALLVALGSFAVMPAAFARDVVLGNCQHGVVTSTTHYDPVTGTTRVVVCYPIAPVNQ